MAIKEMDRARLGRIGGILGAWLREGDDTAYLDGEGPLPAHPELYYRRSGEWRGWVVLADTEENRQQDELEEQAWIVWKAMHA